MKFTLPAKEMIALGKNGHELSETKGANSFSFTKGKEEPYARVVADYGNGANVFKPCVQVYKFAAATSNRWYQFSTHLDKSNGRNTWVDNLVQLRISTAPFEKNKSGVEAGCKYIAA